MANKRYDQFSTVAPTTSRIILTADAATGALGKCTTQAMLNLTPPLPNCNDMVHFFGSPIIATACFLNPYQMSGTQGASNTAMYIQLIYIPAATVTGFWYCLNRAAVFTPNNYNGAVLYSISGSTATLVRATANTPAMFTVTAGSFGQIAFTSTVALAAGYYYVGYCYSFSAQTTQPLFYTPISGNLVGASNALGMSNSVRMQMLISGTTTAVATINLPSFGTTNSQIVTCGVY